ncbi:E3 ubiquitin-protein ligase BRE1-like 2 isoform X2 [Magnolia sinica]|uniref:E3 ubiquitin-protein ligase BRE1-like 2 isoform X2 n=1 Tax=Magnolia sinica TaxID=86752 RepID=UPI00265A8247|nr:E3 ubiquitin-protein ligase BRE1-like 2 isoform X2 [Magnolia sinica]
MMRNADDGDEPEKKKRHLNSVPSSPMAKNSLSPPDGKPVDAADLQYRNQKLVQQLDAQKNGMHVLEGKFKELKDKQISYDETLITVNRLWNQLVDDLILLGLRAGGYEKGLQALDVAHRSRGVIPSCPAEETFLCGLLQTGPIESNDANETIKHVEEALASRHSSTMELMKYLEETIDAQRAKTESLSPTLGGKLSAEDAFIQLHKIGDLLREEASNLRRVIDIIHSKHKEYTDEMQKYLESQSTDQSEIKRLAGELEESMAELEESRRKLVNLKMQKDGVSGVHVPLLGTVNGGNSPDKPADRTMGLRELKDSVEEAKTLAGTRLSELEEAREDNLILTEKLQTLQNELEDDKYVVSSKPYSLLSDQLQHLNAELERCKGLTDALQADRNNILRREKELSVKGESADAARSAVSDAELKIQELELQLQKCIIERNDLEIKLEEAEQDSGRKDIKSEFRVMASALSKEMEMMETQLNRSKQTACEAISLREEAHSLKALLDRKMSEHKSLSNRCAEQMVEIKSLKALIENLQKQKQELQIFLDMYGQECFEKRDVTEIKESERRAQVQAEILKSALDEHSLELRVKAANEAEAACQQRLSAAEAEIVDLRAKLDASERQVLELKEAIKIKDGEADAYISEIETIGQAYEDMQTQNQHLLQQVAERDDYNIKLVSESVKAKQAQSCLLSEKQTIAKQLQQVNESLDFLKLKIARSEEQMKASLIQAGKVSLENRHLAINMESAKLELVDAEKELKWLRSAVDSSEKEYEQNQRKIVELQAELESERNEKKKLEEELAEWNSKVTEMSSENREAAIQKLQDEIKECKAILKCGVCFDRPKEVVIIKCYHLFCYPCIQRNLEIRHRKCPGCGTPFGQNDVREVNI